MPDLLRFQAEYGSTQDDPYLSVRYWRTARGDTLPLLTESDLKELALDPKIESTRRYVPLFFSTNRHYFLGKVKSIIPASLDDAAQRLHRLLMARGPTRADDRKSAIEVQVRDAISLRNELLYVVLPREFLDDESIRHAILVDWNCRPIPYNTFDGDAPNQYYSVTPAKLLERYSEATRI